MEHKPAADPGNKLRSSVLFTDFQNLQRIWTHPRVMRYNSDKFEINAQKKVHRVGFLCFIYYYLFRFFLFSAKQCLILKVR